MVIADDDPNTSWGTSVKLSPTKEIFSLILFAACTAHAQGLSQPESDPPTDPQAQTTSTHERRPGPAATSAADADEDDYGLTGDWGGARNRIRDRGGLSLGGSYTAEWNSVLDGGVNQRGSFRNILAIEAELDLSAYRWEGARVFFQYLSVNPEGGVRGGSNDVGDIQGISNIETRRHLDIISELWFEQALFDERLRFKFGKMDANAEFAYVDAATDFAHSSAGISPTIFTIPTYPDPATGATIFAMVHRTDNAAFTLGYGIFDGAAAADGVETGRRGPSTFFNDRLSDDYFHIAQAELAWEDLGSIFGDALRARWLGKGRLSAGFWHHTGTFDRFDGSRQTGVNGVYATIEQRVVDWQQGGMDAFVQFGWTEDDISQVGTHWAIGFDAHGVFPHRPNDSLGLYASLAVLSDKTGAGLGDDELAIEAYYRLDRVGSLFLQPSVQFIANPGGNDALDDAWVLGLRAGLSF